MNLSNNIITITTIIFDNINKIIDSIIKYKKDKRNRIDIEKVRNKRELANSAKVMGHNKMADYFENEARIIEKTLEIKYFNRIVFIYLL